MERYKLGPHLVKGSGKGPPEKVTSGLKLECPLRTRKSLGTDRAGSLLLSWEDCPRRTNSRRAHRWERARGEWDPRLKQHAYTVCHSTCPGLVTRMTLDKLLKQGGDIIRSAFKYSTSSTVWSRDCSARVVYRGASMDRKVNEEGNIFWLF